MNANEVRAIKISGDGINELLWEMLNKYGSTILDLSDDSESIFHMKWDKEKDELTFYALEFETPHPVDFDAIDTYIDEKIGITTTSIFCDNLNDRPYKTFIFKTSNQGDYAKGDD